MFNLLIPRLIPTLLLNKRSLYKTKNFKNAIYLGDPINTVKIFNDKEADELIILDIEASKKSLKPDFSYIENLASECFMPLTYGGGIKSLDIAKELFDLGVEKISLNSSLTDYKLIEEISKRYGAQSIVASIDYKKNFFGKNLIPTRLSGTEKLNIDIQKLIENLIDSGIGELMIQSIDREGTYSGYDINFLKELKSFVNIPIIISGGARGFIDFEEATLKGARGVAAGSFFVFRRPNNAVLITYPPYELIAQKLGFEAK